MNRNFFKYLNWVIFVFFVLLFAYSLLVYFNVVPNDFFIFNMQFFGKFYQRAIQYVIILFILKLAFYFWEKKKGYYKEFDYALLLISIPFFIDALGNLFGWYTLGESYSVVWYDDLSHIAGGFFVALGTFNILKVAFKESSLYLSAIAAFGIAFAIGTLFGVSEYYSDLWISTAMVGGLVDAITDNIYDFTGSFSALILLLICIKASFVSEAELQN